MTYITESMIYGSLKYQMNRSQNIVAENAAVTSSGLAIQNAADNPDGAAKVLAYDDQLQQIEGQNKVAIDVQQRLTDSENTMARMLKVLNTALANAVEAGNGVYTANDRQNLSKVATSTRDDFLQLANATSNGRYLFGGFTDNAAPYAVDGTYTGDGNVARLEIGPDLWVDANVPGSSFINPTTGQNIVTVLSDLVTSLQNPDIKQSQDQVRSAITPLRDSLTQVTQALSAVGAGPQATIDYAQELRQSLKGSVQAQRAAYRDADFTGSMSDLIQSSTAMQAAMMVSQQVIRSINSMLMG